MKLPTESIAALFEENFSSFKEIGASVSIWREGREILSLSAGFQDRQKTKPWTAETRVLIWSATKGLAAGTLLKVLESEGVSLDRRVSEIWPEFAENGKSEITLAQVLSHQAGLPGLIDPAISVLDHTAVCAALAAQASLWRPGEKHGYHTRTFGFLLDELVRRLTSETLGKMWRTLFGDPLSLDLWIGLPENLSEDVAPVFPALNPGNLSEQPFWKAMADPKSFTRLAFSTPAGLPSVSSMNTPAARQISLPAMNGIGTAHALGKWYAMLANGGEMDGKPFFSTTTLAAMSRILTSGIDVVSLEHTAFSAGFMLDPLNDSGQKIRHLYGPSTRAFGHPGAGGSHAFADPENNLAFAYVMNQMEIGIFPNAKSLRLMEALYAP